MSRPFIGGRSEDADRFLADLLGIPARRPARPGAARARQPAPEPPEHEEPDAGPPLPGAPSASPAPASPPPAPSPAPASGDAAVTETMALLVSDRAPLPVTCGEKERAAADPGVRDDYRAVCAIVPAAPEPRLLVFFHGNDNYVTVERGGGSSPPAAASRPPRWADRPGRAAAAAKKAAALSYRLDALAAAQGALQQAALSSLPVKAPTVLVPEDAERTTGRFWAVPPRCQYGTARDAASGGAGTPGLGLLVSDCYARLRALASPAGRPYLPPAGTDPAAQPSTLRRVYLSGHSGGGKPLGEAAFSDVALPATSGAPGARPAELWLLDCTYGFGTRNHVAFCERWHRAGALAWRPDAARLVCVYRPRSRESDTETEADDLRRALARVLGVSAASLLKLHDSADMSAASMARDVIPALVSSPVVFVRTNVGHDRIPTLFTPLLLRTAAS